MSYLSESEKDHYEHLLHCLRIQLADSEKHRLEISFALAKCLEKLGKIEFSAPEECMTEAGQKLFMYRMMDSLVKTVSSRADRVFEPIISYRISQKRWNRPQ